MREVQNGGGNFLAAEMIMNPPATFAEQVALLKGRGCIIRDDAACEEFLRDVNYYRLSGYLAYKTGIHFEQIQRIYSFDHCLRSIILAAICEIEIRVRTKCAYFFSHKYGGEGYLDTSNFNGKHDHTRFIGEIQAITDRNKNEPCIAHYIKKYNGRVPMWVVVEYFTLGMLSRFYADLRGGVREIIAKSLGTEAKYLESWLHTITVMRNTCAHYDRLYYKNFAMSPKPPPHLRQGQAANKLFAQLLPLKLLAPNPEKWNQTYLAQLSLLFMEYSGSIDCAHIGFPGNWEEILRNAAL